MNGIHDLGGMQGFGKVRVERGEPIFHGDWERRVLGMYVAASATGSWNIDMARQAREDRAPAEYLSLSYYQIWLAGLERLALATGLVTREELSTGKVSSAPKQVARVLRPEAVTSTLLAGWPAERNVGFAPRFKVGDAVKTRVFAPAGHTRLPRYAMGRLGVIQNYHGAHVFPDANAHGHGEAPHHMYTVRFDGAELWGPDTTVDAVHLNCWEPYLEPAP